MEFLVYTLAFGSGATLTLVAYPLIFESAKIFFTKKAEQAQTQLEDIFLILPKRRLITLHILAPSLAGVLGFLLTKSPVVAALGALAGLVIPKLVLDSMRSMRLKRFQEQFVDTLLLMSSSLRAGLSMLQAITVVSEEMPPPSSQEFGLLLKETRMGVSLDEALVHFKQRVPSDDTNLFVTMMLVARETGGDITTIFGRLVETMRERKKMKERVKTLTFMPRMQALIMALIPVAFVFVTYQMDPNHFQFFLTDPQGKVLLTGVILLQIISWILFLRFSRSPLL